MSSNVSGVENSKKWHVLNLRVKKGSSPTPTGAAEAVLAPRKYAA
jgi:hypothetical protein